jgi:Transglycosylase-like domain
MHVRKRTGPFERRHTAAPTLAGSASRTTTGQDVVSGGSTRRPLGVASRRGVSVRLVAGIGAALVALAAAGTFGLRGGSAQASVAPANSVMAFGAAPTLGTPGVKPVASFVGIAATASGLGYWVAAEDGGVFAFGDAAFYGSAGTKTLYQPIVGIAATPSGRGYWLVGRDGGVFAFGDATFYGSAGGETLNEPIVGIAASADGHGYWLVARDGGVFAFGDAPFLGSVARLDLGAAVVGIAATPSHEGYWLVAADGGVFSFGDATFAGSEASTTVNDATGIAAGRTGYWIARAAGAVRGFGTGLDQLGVAALVAPGAATVGIAPQAGGGFWTVQGAQAPPAVTVDHMNPFLVCTRSHESSHTPPAYDNGYAAVNPSGTYRGAYQFSQSTWNNAALRAGRLDLVGIDPAAASVADQDLLALDLYHWQGAGPWMGRCSGL